MRWLFLTFLVMGSRSLGNYFGFTLAILKKTDVSDFGLMPIACCGRKRGADFCFTFVIRALVDSINPVSVDNCG